MMTLHRNRFIFNLPNLSFGEGPSTVGCAGSRVRLHLRIRSGFKVFSPSTLRAQSKSENDHAGMIFSHDEQGLIPRCKNRKGWKIGPTADAIGLEPGVKPLPEDGRLVGN